MRKAFSAKIPRLLAEQKGVRLGFVPTPGPLWVGFIGEARKVKQANILAFRIRMPASRRNLQCKQAGLGFVFLHRTDGVRETK